MRKRVVRKWANPTLVPWDLHHFAVKNEGLTLELALGWCIGVRAEEHFDGLEQVRIACARRTDTADALDMLLRDYEPMAAVRIEDGERPWDVLFHHALTGEMLAFSMSRNPFSFHAAGGGESGRYVGDPTMVVHAENAGFTLIQAVNVLVSEPLEHFCRIETHVCLPVRPGSVKEPCVRCGAREAQCPMVSLDGQTVCLDCAGMPEPWFRWE